MTSENLQQEITELKALNELLKDSLKGICYRIIERFEFVTGDISSDLHAEVENANKIWDAMSHQSLALHDADVIEKFAGDLTIGLLSGDGIGFENLNEAEFSGFTEVYTQQLRNKNEDILSDILSSKD